MLSYLDGISSIEIYIYKFFLKPKKKGGERNLAEINPSSKTVSNKPTTLEGFQNREIETNACEKNHVLYEGLANKCISLEKNIFALLNICIWYACNRKEKDRSAFLKLEYQQGQISWISLANIFRY